MDVAKVPQVRALLATSCAPRWDAKGLATRRGRRGDNGAATRCCLRVRRTTGLMGKKMSHVFTYNMIFGAILSTPTLSERT